MDEPVETPRDEILLGRCCECGIGLDPRTHPTMTCVNCLQARADIAEGVCPNGQMHKCRRCQRYCGGGTTYVACEPESRELMAICLKRVRGLKRVRVADAAWIWTEPHSMRLKVRLTIQKEVAPGAVLQKPLDCEFVVRNQQCRDCAQQYENFAWTAAVQVRQRVDHKRTFFYLEQAILKKNAQASAVKIEQFRDGLDFFFRQRNDAVRFVQFLKDCVPCRVKETKKLVSADPKSNLFNHQYTSLVTLAEACKEDLVVVDARTAARLGQLPRLLLVRSVNAVVRLVDPQTGRTAELHTEGYFKAPPSVAVSASQLERFVVLDVERVHLPKPKEVKAQPSSKKRRRQDTRSAGPRVMKGFIADVTLARESDLGRNNDQITCRTHLGAILKCGDRVLGYDVRAANTASYVDGLGGNEPDVVLIRKCRKQDPDGPFPKRQWKLDQIRVDENHDENDHADDREIFLAQLENDREMRSRVNLYKDGDHEEGEHEEDVKLEELLDAVALDEVQKEVEEECDDRVLEGVVVKQSEHMGRLAPK